MNRKTEDVSSGEPKTLQTKHLVLLAVYVAIGLAGSVFVSIPMGIARAFPVQHAINVMIAVTMGPLPVVLAAFVTAMLRIVTGTGTLLAIPGSMIGALLAGICYKYTKKEFAAAGGEVIGTGLLASLVSIPYASLFMGKEVALMAILPGFLSSTLLGSGIAYAILKSGLRPYMERNL